MADIYSSFVRFTYTVLNPDGLPQKKSHLLNLNYIVNIESGDNNDFKIHMANDQQINIEVGKDNDVSKLINDILDYSAEGIDYNVYNVNSFAKK